MNDPRVSVVIPAYNHERFVAEAVHSVLTQTLSDLELIIIDDGSTDRTGERAQSFRDERLHYFQQENQDAYNAINNGLRRCRGRYLAILNSDDVYAPNRLQQLVAAAEKTGAQFLFTQVEPIDEFSRPIPVGKHYWHLWHERNRKFYEECGDLYAAFLRGNLMVTTSNVFMTRRAYETIGEFAALRYLHDYDYIFRALLAFPQQVLYLKDAALLKYRIHGTNTLKQGAITAREEDLRLITKYMLAGMAEPCRLRAATGAERLRELERELADVHKRLSHSPRYWVLRAGQFAVGAWKKITAGRS